MKKSVKRILSVDKSDHELFIYLLLYFSEVLNKHDNTTGESKEEICQVNNNLVFEM